MDTTEAIVKALRTARLEESRMQTQRAIKIGLLIPVIAVIVSFVLFLMLR